MYGAILGDIIGSRFEFDRGGKTKDFELFTKEDTWTDDTAMTVAVAEGLMNAGKDASAEEIHDAVIRSMKRWGHKYRNAGYGGRFYRWLFTQREPKPYGSYGNGSAMRVSAAGWLYDSLERTREAARATAEVTHNHPEGIKGAECTAAVIYLSRTGAEKAEIRDYVVREFGYDLSRTVDELRPLHEHVETCQDSMPKALASFLEGISYEDVVRNAVSLGGDTDTLGAIAGSMAEAYYGIPVLMIADGKSYLPEDMAVVLDRFDSAIGRKQNNGIDEDYRKNRCISEAVSVFGNAENNEHARFHAVLGVLNALLSRMFEEGQAPMPMIDVNHVMDGIDPDKLVLGLAFKLDQELRLSSDTVTDSDGHEWIPLYTEENEINKGNVSGIRINVPISTILDWGLNSADAEGVVINPFGESMQLPKSILGILYKKYEEIRGMGNRQ